MYATFSLEAKLVTGLEELSMPVQFFGEVADDLVSVSRLKQAIKGGRPLDTQTMQRLIALLQEFHDLQSEHAPVPIKWANPGLFKSILQQRREHAEQ